MQRIYWINLKASPIYREDQYSYMLYPNRELPGFLKRNNIPGDFIDGSSLAQRMIEDNDGTILHQDVDGIAHFNRNFNNADDLIRALEEVRSKHPELVDSEYNAFLRVFEEMFNHSAFTGRSGTFYGYEGLGSIYWHMVSKLLLAVQENIMWAGQDNSARDRLIEHYYEIRAGIGVNKTPDLYGSFPCDPYSHTPWHKGVQQPGMTGQVKEDILNRWAELGICVDDGRIRFAPKFLNEQEFASSPTSFKYVDLAGRDQSIDILQGQLAFTYCQIPVVYGRSSSDAISITMQSGEVTSIQGNRLTKELSALLFSRTGEIVQLIVSV